MARYNQESAAMNGSYSYLAPSSSDDGVPRQQLRVLVADDCRDTANTLAMLVRVWGHEVRVAYDGAAALKMAMAYQPDVLLLDLAMPQMDGLCLVRELRRLPWSEDALLVAVTGYADEAHRLLGLKAGFHQYLAKPVAPTALKNLLSQARGRQERLPIVPSVGQNFYGISVAEYDTPLRGVLV